MKRTLALIALISIPIQAAEQTNQVRRTRNETYESADIDAAGNLRIVTSDHKMITVPKGRQSSAGESFGNQTAFGKPVLSDDRQAVATSAMFGNCCTSYDIPLQLVVYSQGKTHCFERSLAIFDWHFADGGRRIVFSQQTVHFACTVHWELRDIATERLLAEADIPEPCGEIPDPPKVTIPRWVREGVSGFK